MNDMALVFLIVLGVTGMGYGLWASSRFRSPYNTLAAFLALVGLVVALCATVALTVPGFFAGGLSAALEGVPGFTNWAERRGAAFALSTSVFVLGAIVGSFLNVCIIRLPKDESIISPSSHCSSCKTSIPFYDNIPLLSYINLQGRCRHCNAKISPLYFVVELLMAVLSVALLRRFGLGPAFFVSFVFVAALIVISFIDLDVRIVPDVISLPGIGLGFIFAILNWLWFNEAQSALPSPISSLLGIVIGGGFLLLVAWAYESLTGVEGMGGGDVKLLAMIGAFLGWPAIPITLFLGSLAGSVVGLSFMAFRGFDRKYALPFAPFLCVGALFHIFFGQKLIQFYLP
jgi:leader peptidase (prepilin peptidase)/N-methyltransferase